MQKAVANPHKLPMEELLEPSRQQKASDQMLLFIRAICAVGLLLEPTDSLVNLQTMLEEARVCCRFVLADAILHVICLQFVASCPTLDLLWCHSIWVSPCRFAELFAYAYRPHVLIVFAVLGIWKSA